MLMLRMMGGVLLLGLERRWLLFHLLVRADLFLSFFFFFYLGCFFVGLNMGGLFVLVFLGGVGSVGLLFV